MISDFWQGKHVLVTGHTGFKGSWLCIWLQSMGASVTGLALDPLTEKDNFVLSKLTDKMTDIRGDIRDAETVHRVFSDHKPEIVFHLAAQPLVRLSYEIPRETYETNVMGTLNILEAIRQSDCTRVGVMITTDKCYENKEQIWGYRETDPMGGYDPYSSSKGCAELLIASYRSSFMNPEQYDKHKKAIASVRAGNVIGGGDWAKDRIVPDCIRAIEKDEPVEIRTPQSVRPFQHVLEPLSGYLMLAEKLYFEPVKYASGWNFGPNPDSIVTVFEVAEKLVKHYGKGRLLDLSKPNDLHEAKLLSLDISKAKFHLGWNPKMDVSIAVKLTADWYKAYKNTDVYTLCENQIAEYVSL